MPESRDPRELRGASRGQTPAAETARSVRVLILDEDRVEGGMLAFHLRREGLVVMLMTSVEEASDAIAWSAPDVVLVEVTGRGFDGHEFLTQLATMPVDVFAVADRPLELEDELEVLRLGVIDVLMKPLDPLTLARRLNDRPKRERRGSVADLPEGGISGDIAVHTATHILTLAHRHKMNARLHVEIDGDWAVLLVRQGEVIDAEAPNGTGREAAYQVLRATRGAFVLFPLLPDAEELSRDDVVRADLATLVGDALGRQEPRPVNAARAREQETFVLPHVGSPRGPLARRGGDDTLEYMAQGSTSRPSNTARVKRPGERIREERGGNTVGGPDPRPPMGTEVFRSAPASAVSRQPLVSRSNQPGDATEARTVVPVEAMRKALDARRVTLDDGFDEATDQAATSPHGDGRPQRSGDTIIQTPRSQKLRRVGGPRTGESNRVSRKKTDPELAALREEPPELAPPPSPTPPPARVVAAPAPPRSTQRPPARAGVAPLTLVLSLVLVALLVFVVFRLATRETVTAAPEDFETRFGRALLELDAGRRDAARSELAALVVAPEAPSGAVSMLARIFYEDGRLPESQALLERLVERHPRDAEVLSWLGLVLLERDEVERARELFERARRVGPTGTLASRLDQLERILGGSSPRDRESSPPAGQRPAP